jgi:tetratricopeptide (TPR) repeat protein
VTRTIALLLAVLSLLVTTSALAAGANDSALRSIIRDIFKSEVAKKKYKNALTNLDASGGICEGGACSNQAQAELWVAMGMVQAMLGKKGEAKTSFTAALKLDPKARLRAKYANAKVKAAWGAAKGQKKQSSAKGCRGSYSKKSPPRDWRNGEAYHCYLEAKNQRNDGNYKQCAEDARASLELEKQLRSRAVLAGCLEKDNAWKEAIDQYRELARRATSSRQYNQGKKWSQRASTLQRRMPSLLLEAPDDVEDLVIKLDGAEIPADVVVGLELEVDPGEHEVAAEGISDGLPVGFQQKVLLKPSKTVTLLLTMSPGNPDPQTQRILKCLAEGKAPEDCLKKTTSVAGDLKFRVALETSVYHDDMDVDVTAPSIATSVEHVTDGWGLGAAFLVDIVTAASVDILATASPRWREIRYVPAINGHFGIDDYDFALTANLSHEPDYIALAAGLTISAEFRQKTVTPSLGYEYSYDIDGRAKTPFDVFSTTIQRHALNLGLDIVADKATFMSFSGTAVFENGDGSKPYRHIPMFAPDVAPFVKPGTVIDAVNFFREPERPLEQLPVERKRFAVAWQIAHRWGSSTIRASERIYFDTWGTKATTTDAKFYYDIVKEFRFWPHLRFHAQTPADFYELAYVAERTPDGVKLPPLRTGDRELGPLIGITGGLGARVEFGERRAYGFMINGDVAYTRFLDHLYVKERLGYFGALTFDAEFE